MPEPTGTLIVVVGPSGSGKDSVIALASRHFAGNDRIHFARRFITRPADAGGEAHLSVTDAEFEALCGRTAFCVSWEAHGLKYGIPADVLARVSGGETVIVNGSRRALHAFRAAFDRIAVVNIVAAPGILAQRLAARGRESAAEIEARLRRPAPEPAACEPDTIVLDNSGLLAEAASRFIGLITGIAAGKSLKELSVP